MKIEELAQLEMLLGKFWALMDKKYGSTNGNRTTTKYVIKFVEDEIKELEGSLVRVNKTNKETLDTFFFGKK